MKTRLLKSHLSLIIIFLMILSCTHNGYEGAIANGSWVHLGNREREGWYLRVDNYIYGSDVTEIKCCIKYNKPLKGVDANTFEAEQNSDYAKDKNHVYYPLQVRCEDWLKDDEEGCYNSCYFMEHLIKGADPKTFKYLGDGYAVDRRHMYDEGREIPWDNEIIKRYQKQTVPNDSKP